MTTYCGVQLPVFRMVRRAADLERKARHDVQSSDIKQGCRHPSLGQRVARDFSREAIFPRFPNPKKIEGLPRSLQLLGGLIFIIFVWFFLFFSFPPFFNLFSFGRLQQKNLSTMAMRCIASAINGTVRKRKLMHQS